MACACVRPRLPANTRTEPGGSSGHGSRGDSSPLRKPTEVKEKENGVSVNNNYLYGASFLTGVNGSLGLTCIQESIQEKLTLPEPFNAILEARSLYQHLY